MDHIKVMPPIDTTTPALGRAIRHEWALDPDYLPVNLGSFGAILKIAPVPAHPSEILK